MSVVPQTPKHGSEFEHLHVRSVYDEIAPCMNDIEHKAWPNVKRFLKKLPFGAVVADIGMILSNGIMILFSLSAVFIDR